GREPGAQHRLARQVPVLGVADDGPADGLVDVHAFQVVAIDQSVEHADQHLQVRFVGIERVGAAERDAHAADHRHAPEGLVHWALRGGQTPCLNVASLSRCRSKGSDPLGPAVYSAAVRLSTSTLDFCSLAAKCSGPPRNGAKPVPKMTPASTRSALSTIFSSRTRSASRISGSTSSRPSRSSSNLSHGFSGSVFTGLPSFQTQKPSPDFLPSLPAATMSSSLLEPPAGASLRILPTCAHTSRPTVSASSMGPIGMPKARAASSIFSLTSPRSSRCIAPIM